MKTNNSRDIAHVRIAALCWLITSLHSSVPMIRADETAIVDSEMNGWIPITADSDNLSPILPLAHQRNTSSVVTKSKAQFGRAFHDNRLDGGTFDVGTTDYQALELTNAPASPTPVHFHTHLKTAPLSSAPTSASNSPFGLTSTGLNSIHSFHQSHAGSSTGYHYPLPQYLPPLPSQYLPAPPVHSVEIASEYQEPEHYYYQHYHHTENANNSHLEINTANRLFLQPGKCSNSIEVGRTRDVEVRTALKSGSQKGICVLMLYTPNLLNKLAISLQAVQGTTNVIPTGTWLETNVKVYAIQAGDIQPVYTK